MPDFLFTSGKANRFNREGTECLYLAEDEQTALAEYRRQFMGLAHGARQPVTLFYAEVKLNGILDLTQAVTRRMLGVSAGDLEADWSRKGPVTVTQALGEAVARTACCSAIRYRSVAAARGNQPGHNWVIFKACLRSTEIVRILGPTRRLLQQWP